VFKTTMITHVFRVMNLLLRKVCDRHISKTIPPKDKRFAQTCTIED